MISGAYDSYRHAKGHTDEVRGRMTMAALYKLGFTPRFTPQPSCYFHLPPQYSWPASFNVNTRRDYATMPYADISMVYSKNARHYDDYFVISRQGAPTILYARSAIPPVHSQSIGMPILPKFHLQIQKCRAYITTLNLMTIMLS